MTNRDPAADANVTIGNAYGERSLNNEPFDVEAIYAEHHALLRFVACEKFRVPEEEAEGLVQDVFVSLMQVRSPVTNIRAWLVAAICNASRHYWRRIRHDVDAVPERLDDDLDTRDRLTEAVLSYLEPACREVVRRYHFERKSIEEVARDLDTTTPYAEKLVRRCMKRALALLATINRE